MLSISHHISGHSFGNCGQTDLRQIGEPRVYEPLDMIRMGRGLRQHLVQASHFSGEGQNTRQIRSRDPNHWCGTTGLSSIWTDTS